jgi:hypothetical protein
MVRGCNLNLMRCFYHQSIRRQEEPRRGMKLYWYPNEGKKVGYIKSSAVDTQTTERSPKLTLSKDPIISSPT